MRSAEPSARLSRTDGRPPGTKRARGGFEPEHRLLLVAAAISLTVHAIESSDNVEIGIRW